MADKGRLRGGQNIKDREIKAGWLCFLPPASKITETKTGMAKGNRLCDRNGTVIGRKGKAERWR